MQDVETAGLVLGIDGCRHRIDRGFHRSPGQPAHDHADIEHHVGRRSVTRHGRQDDKQRPDDETGGGKQRGLLRAEHVEQRTHHQQGQREAEKAVAERCGDQLARTGGHVRVEQRFLDRARNARAHRKAQRRGKQQQYADPENRPRICRRRDGLVHPNPSLSRRALAAPRMATWHSRWPKARGN